MPAVPVRRSARCTLGCAPVLRSARMEGLDCVKPCRRCARRTERLSDVPRCTVAKFAERPICGEKDRPTCDEKAARPAPAPPILLKERPPPPPPNECPPPPPPLDLWGAASAFIGIARALASNAAIRQPDNFSMTEYPPQPSPRPGGMSLTAQ